MAEFYHGSVDCLLGRSEERGQGRPEAVRQNKKTQLYFI